MEPFLLGNRRCAPKNEAIAGARTHKIVKQVGIYHFSFVTANPWLQTARRLLITSKYMANLFYY